MPIDKKRPLAKAGWLGIPHDDEALVPPPPPGVTKETVVHRAFHMHSARKDNAFVESCETVILRTTPSEGDKRRLAEEASDALLYCPRAAYDGNPTITVNLEKFDGTTVYGKDAKDYIVKCMDVVGMIGGKHAHIPGKCELKYVTFVSEDAPSPSEPASFGGAFAAALPPECDPAACVLATEHRDSGVQHLNQT